MTTSLHRSLLFADPGELISAIPGMLGFVPAESLVLVTYTGRGLESVLRIDLAAADHLDDLTEQLRIVALNHEATVIDLIVLCGTDPPGPPHGELIERLGEVFDEEGIVLDRAVWAPRLERDLPWRSYRDPECAGQIPDPATSPINAVMAAAGVVPRASRDEVAAQLAPDPPEALARRAELLAAATPADPELARPLLRDTVDTLGEDDPGLDDETIARLARALSHPDVRETCLAFALTPRAASAERLWVALTRAVPGPARAEPATLLAACAYLRGEGALACLAVDAALHANPDHTLAHTVRRVMDLGFTPDSFRHMLGQSFAAAFAHR